MRMCVSRLAKTNPREYGYIIHLLFFTALLIIPASGQTGDGHLFYAGGVLFLPVSFPNHTLLIVTCCWPLLPSFTLGAVGGTLVLVGLRCCLSDSFSMTRVVYGVLWYL